MKALKLGTALAVMALSVSATAADYVVDLAHSRVQFAANHMGFSKLIGNFNEFEGTFSIDEGAPATASASLKVFIDSIDTNHEKRDAHLRSPDFFDAKQYPEMTFQSTSYLGTIDSGKLSGNLTILGVSVPTTFDLKKIGFGDDPWGGIRIGYVATTLVNRSDFGMNYSVPGIPVEVEVSVFIEGIQKK